VIELLAAHARVAQGALAPTTLRLDAGIHALLGLSGRADGTAIVLGLITGAIAPRSGSVQVGGMPAGDARVRPTVAHVALDVALPEPLRVDEALAMAAAIRGEPARDPADRLAALGVADLARRPVRSLTLEEKRAVALAEAVTSGVRVLLVEEPHAVIDARAVVHVARALRARADAGACVVFTTASAHDARTLADAVVLFDGGVAVRRAPAADLVALTGPRGAVFHVVASDPKALAAALASDPAVETVAVDHGAVRVRGAAAIAVAAAIARAAAAAGVAIEALRPEVLPKEELRAAAAGDVAGAYRAAFDRARQTYGAPVPLPVPPEGGVQ
jgi:ABC-type multidrug transport system ATPase subunit